MLHDDRALKILQILKDGKANSAEIAERVGLAVETIRSYLKLLQDEAFVQCTKSDNNNGKDYVYWLAKKGKAALENSSILVSDEKKPSTASLNEQKIDLASQGINQEEAEVLRASLTAFADDWNSPEMSVYDHFIADADVNQALKHTLGLD